MPKIQRRLEFDAGHRVLNHESKCNHLHGHRYVVELEVASDGLDQLGRVVDFSCLKEVVGGWIDRRWDHNILLNADDPLSHLWNNERFRKELFKGKQPYMFPHGVNPTAENMAAVLFVVAQYLLHPHALSVSLVTIHETPNCRALCDTEECRRWVATLPVDWQTNRNRFLNGAS
jgi:6-pyruvoyltetrahydropterin/6-carboxytetrahydropterin synthase